MNLWLLARRGAVHVPEFTAAPDEKTPVLSATLRFRDRLSSLHLESELSTQPGAADTADFASIVGSVTLEPKHAVTTLMTLIRTAIPTHAFEVKASLQTRAEKPCSCGVAVQVVRRPKTVSAMRTCWAPTFAAAVDIAANEAAAFILPRTNRCSYAPWRAWRGYVVPPPLLDAYERGSACVSQRRYDEALALFTQALRLDPLNLDMRLRVGLVQEQLGLYLDALDTYMAMYNVEAAATRQRRGRPPRNVRIVRRETLNVALYREAILLGGQALTAQWRRAANSDRPTRRDSARHDLRMRLRPLLSRRLKRLGISATDIRRLLEEPQGSAARPEKEVVLRHRFQQLAMRDLDRLASRLRFRVAPFPTRAAVATSRACVSLRLQQTTAALWHPPKRWEQPAEIAQQVKRALGCHVLPRQGGRKWDAQYNIACLYAIAWRPGVSTGDYVPARSGVQKLEETVARVDSGFVAGRAQWLLREDPDFDLLRLTQEFRRFESQFFLYERAANAPKDRHMAAVFAHTRNLQAKFATSREQLWHDRAARATDAHIHDVCRWWKAERKSWSQIARLAADYRHWPVRWEVIESCKIGTAEEGLAPVDVAYPTPDRLTPSRERSIPRIELLEGVDEEPLGEHLERVGNQLRWLDSDGSEIPAERLAQLCSCEAALWQLVNEWVEEPATQDETTVSAQAGQNEDSDMASRFHAELETVVARFKKRGRTFRSTP